MILTNINKQEDEMRLYTSYWGRTKMLQNNGIEPVAICVGKPKWWRGRCIEELAPRWDMLRMSNEQYNEAYRLILSELDPEQVLAKIEDCRIDQDSDVALMCYEKDPADCHRSMAAKWLRDNGIECDEWAPPVKKTQATRVNEVMQLTLF